jgi:hypothetical protein
MSDPTLESLVLERLREIRATLARLSLLDRDFGNFAVAGLR